MIVRQARNKPKEAPKAPSNAPFFLPSLPGTEPRFDFSQSADDKEGKNDSRIGFSSLSVESEIVQALQSEANSGDCKLCELHLVPMLISL